jgi:hypothetical protein
MLALRNVPLGELAGAGVDFDRPGMLFDDDVMAKREAKPGPLAGPAWW